MTEQAPFCPVSYDQEPKNPRGTAPIRLPSIPLATDLPSLIRSVNIMRDILRTLTTSLTVNNFYGGRVTPAKTYGKKSYKMSDYESDWYQVGIENEIGSVFHKPKTQSKYITEKEEDQRVSIDRMHAVEFRNNARDNDQSFYWRYHKKLDGEQGDPLGTPFEEDFFERIVNVNWNSATEIKPGGLVFQSSAKVADPSSIMIAVAVRISKKVADAAKAAHETRIPIFEFGTSTDEGTVTDTAIRDMGGVVIGIGFDFGSFTFPHYHVVYGSNVFLLTGMAIEGGPVSGGVHGEAFFTGGYPPSQVTDPSTPSSFVTDSTPYTGPVPGREASGATVGGTVAPGGWTYQGQVLTYRLVEFYGNIGGFFGGTWVYEFDDLTFSFDSPTPPLAPSVLYLDASDNSVWLDVANRAELDSYEQRIFTGDGSDAGEFKLDKWNHILISGDLGDGPDSQETWSVTINGVPGREHHFTGHPDMKTMALQGLEIGVPAIPSDIERKQAAGPNRDLDYIGLRVWFDKKYVNVTDPAVIELFVTDEKKLVNPKKAEEQFGKPDVFMNHGARSFIKNKGTAGAFNATGFVDGTDGLIINYSPYPRFVGPKDTSVPSEKNRP